MSLSSNDIMHLKCISRLAPNEEIVGIGRWSPLKPMISISRVRRAPASLLSCLLLAISNPRFYESDLTAEAGPTAGWPTIRPESGFQHLQGERAGSPRGRVQPNHLGRREGVSTAFKNLHGDPWPLECFVRAKKGIYARAGKT